MNITKTKLFWILATLVSLTGIAFTIKYFKRAFPIANVEVSVDRADALEKARYHATSYGIGPDTYAAAASFENDRNVQNYIELEAGGSEAFNEVIKGSLYAPFTWHVRHFNEGSAHECTFYFKPDGTPYGFVEKLPEETSLPSLAAHTAQKKAEALAQQWNIDLALFESIETAKDEKPNGRVDYTFVYEQQHVSIGEGKYRLTLSVSGNKVTGIQHTIKIPESFFLRYEEMRSANTTLATAASLLMYLLYLILGCFIGLFILMRKRYVLWKQPLIWTGIMATLSLAKIFNEIPLHWMFYDTAVSKVQFLVTTLIGSFISMLFSALIFLLSAAAAESLTRMAFGNQIQLWKLWKPSIGNTVSVLGRTIGGYLIVGLHLAFIVLMYLFSRSILGWWVPSDTMIDPNILATYIPWLPSVTDALHAGFWEECLFRAVPLAGAALLGRKFKKERLFIVIGFIIQILIFGAAHANYATQPFYGRLVELIIPSTIFGAVYLMFGLLPSILSHFVFDLILMSQPLFASASSGSIVDKFFVIACGSIPLFVVAYRWWQAGNWHSISHTAYNKAWQPSQAHNHAVHATHTFTQLSPTRATKQKLCGIAIFATLTWAIVTPWKQNAPTMSISRSTAITRATEALAHSDIKLEHPWQPLAQIVGVVGTPGRFVWQETNTQTYERLVQQHYLDEPTWLIRFVRFTGSVDDRREEYHIFVDGIGSVLRVRHVVPESFKGESLSETQARTKVHKALKDILNKDIESLKEISAIPTKLPERTDWQFTFSDKTIFEHGGGEARISVTVSGNIVSDIARHIHVPEAWERNDRSTMNLLQNISGLSSTLLRLMFIVITLFILMNSLFAGGFFLKSLGILFSLWCINSINAWQSVLFAISPIRPFGQQVGSIAGSMIIMLLLEGACLALLVAFVQKHSKKTYVYNRSLLAAGAGAVGGMIFATLRHFTQIEPTWAMYSAWSQYAPALGTALSLIAAFIRSSILFMSLLTMLNYLRTKRPISDIALLLIWLIIGLLLVANFGITSVLGWIIAGLALGYTLNITYRFIWSFDPALGIFVIATTTILSALQAAILSAYPVATIGNIVATCLIYALATRGYLLLHRNHHD
ncbi:hypothetical protein JW872_00435 [Candidatus Babeliales bacterium]|nr:hypothetical protein [Candidatus Babeliales bacterium]